MLNGRFEHQYFEASARFVAERIKEGPLIAMILGSGLGPLAEEIEEAVRIPYGEIPNFPVSTVASHKGELIAGRVAGVPVVCMSGRFHYYEGYDWWELTAPVRLFRDLGAKAVILTNAAGAVNPRYRVGDIMLIRDHINLVGASPMRGRNIDVYGERFFDVQNLYSPDLRHLAKKIAAEEKLRMQEGVYYFMPGPHFETPAEIRAIRILGADAVGMSTVPEALTAAHCGLPVLGLSVMTNMAAGISGEPLSDEDVRKTGELVSGKLTGYVKRVIREIAAKYQGAKA